MTMKRQNTVVRKKWKTLMLQQSISQKFKKKVRFCNTRLKIEIAIEMLYDNEEVSINGKLCIVVI